MLDFGSILHQSLIEPLRSPEAPAAWVITAALLLQGPRFGSSKKRTQDRVAEKNPRVVHHHQHHHVHFKIGG